MAFVRSPWIERFSSSSACWRVTFMLFVAFALVGVWMFTSSTVVPLEISPQEASKFELKKQLPQTDSRPSENGSGNAFTESYMSTDHNWDDSQADKFGEAQSEGSKIDVGNQRDGQDNVIGENVERNASHMEDKTIGDKSNNVMKNEEPNLSMNINEFKDGGLQENDKKNSKQSENNDHDGMLSEKDNIRTGDVTKDEVFPNVSQLELLNETNAQVGAWSTQATESRNEKELQVSSSWSEVTKYNWKLCNVTAEADNIPCLDNEEAIKRLPTTKHYEHRERHCPEEAPTCLVPLPNGYRGTIKWPNSREKIWYYNIPHTKLVELKGHQNWVKVSGEYLTFPGGGTQFKFGASRYIDIIQKSFPVIAWGSRSGVILHVGCGVAGFGGSLFDKDVLTMSFAPKDEHEAQVQFALERGIPAILAVMGTKRLPFPGMVFDVIHCARCRVPWHIEGGMLLLELNRLLRPGGFFIWSATPVYRKTVEDIGIWKAMFELTKMMCWEMVSKSKDSVNKVGLVIFRKPSNNECYEQRVVNTPPICQESDDLNASWNVSLQACMHRLPVHPVLRGFGWPDKWPSRLERAPYWLDKAQVGIYGKPAPEDFQTDFQHWKRVVSKSYLNGIGINWSTVRNIMDMRSVYGGCKLLSVIVEVDRILRPEGFLIVRDDMQTIQEIENILKSLHWDIRLSYSKETESLLCMQKKMWRPQEIEAKSASIS
ncbi:probable methyltransferase PMT26 isoform X2 [Phalaenopsis equestris]|uniref:probable methyltransferase PMT26 isoform X2 n=1 Tax=Phalaenopsis equestris TaxID=78828 RepID=UPI0009E3DD68|nr:probable methyltransferase PMT26 isoform X2 [Phalaenopsis equestris]